MHYPIFILIFTLGFFLTETEKPRTNAMPKDGIAWLDIQSGAELSKESDKIMIINIYTDWCGFCKRLDQTTFLDAGVMSTIHDHFIPIKFNAEKKENVSFHGKSYDFIKEGRRGHHALAAYLLDQRLGYPTLVYVQANGEIIHRSPGFRNEADMMKELTYIKDGHYKSMEWRTYKSSN